MKRTLSVDREVNQRSMGEGNEIVRCACGRSFDKSRSSAGSRPVTGLRMTAGEEAGKNMRFYETKPPVKWLWGNVMWSSFFGNGGSPPRYGIGVNFITKGTKFGEKGRRAATERRYSGNRKQAGRLFNED